MERLSNRERKAIIRETFDAFAIVGFLKWKREEIERHGTAPEAVEAERASYVKELTRSAWPQFRDAAAKATDDRLLDVRQDWIERADCMALLDMQGKLTVRHVHEELRRYTGGTYPEPEKAVPSEQKGRDSERERVMEKRPSVTVFIHADFRVSIREKIDPGSPPHDSPRQRAEQAVAQLKEAEISTWLERPGFEAGHWFEPFRDFTWQELPEQNKLAVLERAIDWSGVKASDKRAIFTRELDARQLSEQLREAFLSAERAPDRGRDSKQATMRDVLDREAGAQPTPEPAALDRDKGRGH